MLASSILGLGACADYLDRNDTITLAAGEAQSWNKVIQTTDPWPPYVMNTRITRSGKRVESVAQGYLNGGEAGAAGAAAGPDQAENPAGQSETD